MVFYGSKFKKITACNYLTFRSSILLQLGGMFKFLGILI